MYAVDDTIALQEVVTEDLSLEGCYTMSELWFLICRNVVHFSVGSSRHFFMDCLTRQVKALWFFKTSGTRTSDLASVFNLL
jgi:hypothetical protein